MISSHTQTTRRPGPATLAAGLVLAAILATSAGSAAATTANTPPPAAVARLTDLGFSTRDADRLLRTTQIRPGTAAGSYAAHRIATAVLYGSADAFGGPRYHP